MLQLRVREVFFLCSCPDSLALIDPSYNSQCSNYQLGGPQAAKSTTTTSEHATPRAQSPWWAIRWRCFVLHNFCNVHTKWWPRLAGDMTQHPWTHHHPRFEPIQLNFRTLRPFAHFYHRLMWPWMYHPQFFILQSSNWMDFRTYFYSSHLGEVSWGTRTQWKNVSYPYTNHPWWSCMWVPVNSGCDRPFTTKFSQIWLYTKYESKNK
jgi:hypothetical protein